MVIFKLQITIFIKKTPLLHPLNQKRKVNDSTCHLERVILKLQKVIKLKIHPSPIQKEEQKRRCSSLSLCSL
jgi:hypothetical protein